MKNLKILAILIEYHWWRVDCLRKKKHNMFYSTSFNYENLHKFRAEQLMVLYEMCLGLRDCYGNIVA